MVGVGIQMLRIPFEWLELAFERLESLSNGRSWHSNPVRTVGAGIRTLPIPFEWLGVFFFFFLILVGEIAQWLVG